MMLVSSQIVFFNTVKSDPTPHTGDADVGILWISELDVSSHLQTIDNIGIGHVNATDDWVIWEDGTGNINASWSVDIGNRHPEYFVKFGLTVYNVDDENKNIGNDMFIKTYNTNTGYDESGTLTAALEFTQQQMAAGSQTLVCYLDAEIILNETVEAVNFTSWSQDRCVVAVDFVDPQDVPPFSKYRDKANDKFPSMYTYINGWNEPGLFDDEDDMLNNQTFFKVGSATLASTSDSSGLWDLGDAKIWRDNDLQAHLDFIPKPPYTHTIDPVEGVLTCDVKVDFTIDMYKGKPPRAVLMAYRLWKEDGQFASDWAIRPWCIYLEDPTGDFRTTITADTSDDIYPYPDGDGKVEIWGRFYVALFKGGAMDFMKTQFDPYYIIIGDGQGESVEIEHEYCRWECSCAYHNESYIIPVDSSTISGVTMVEADITDILQSQSTGECVYTFAGDRGDTRIRLTC